MSAFAITRLILTDFRNYDYLKVETDERPVVLTGLNGSGKTNLLEAISFLAPGRGLRRARLGDAANKAGEGQWAVVADVQSPQGTTTVGTGLTVSPLENGYKETMDRRSVKIDGQMMNSSAALAKQIRVNWLTPQMDRLFQEGASGRRRFLDRLTFGFDPAHGKRTTVFEKVMRERNRLLKQGKYDNHWMTSLEHTLSESGVAIAAARQEAVDRLNAAMTRDGTGHISSAFPKAGLNVSGTVEDLLQDMPALAAEDTFREKLETNRHIDEKAGSTTLGPHRSDLAVRHKDKDLPADLCSTGEQKALLISIILADARLQAGQQGQAPVLLLDEITAHLDQTRRQALFDEIEQMKAQAWMTGTDYALFAELGERAQYLTVDNGTVQARHTG
ncbi:DNA replication/repair protein RecF [Sneathiella marina]|uniref:DNA replication and repair protein RecF n=1 Tax=Sneathiella marina TaxID=2950108 RepID=A0ABY4W9P2_9PROT|nr:DNA replication/repair protein RecF [Sneathiella marina]USG61361.1 DNA replication/repair protein RecF [Sneathiella marina]